MIHVNQTLTMMDILMRDDVMNDQTDPDADGIGDACDILQLYTRLRYELD